MLLKNSLILLAVCSLASCGTKGPKVTWCTSSEFMFECSDRGRSIAEVDNYACLSRPHAERLLSSCKQGTSPGKLEYCIVDSASRQLVCPTREISLRDANNWPCMSPTDTERLLTYCKRQAQ